MKDVFIFLVTFTFICSVIYLMILSLKRSAERNKRLQIENEILKHDAPSRIVDTYRIKVLEDNLRATIECGAYPKGMKIIFFTKSDNETLDTYDLTLKELLNILQEHNNN